MTAFSPSVPPRSPAKDNFPSGSLAHSPINPCFVFSGVLMLLGCYLVSNATKVADSLTALVFLFLVLNIYEVLVIAISTWLLRKYQAKADACLLMLVATTLLCDITLVQNAIVSRWHMDVGHAWLVSLVMVAISLGKVLWILKGSRLRFRRPGIIILSIEMMAIALLPWILARVQNDAALGLHWLYGGWIALGILLLIHGLTPSWVRSAGADSANETGQSRSDAISISLKIIPIFSLGLHLWAGEYAYRLWAATSFFFPAWLGLAFVAIRCAPKSWPRPMVWILAGILTLIALGQADDATRALGCQNWSGMVGWLTPWRWLVTLVAVELFLHAWLSRRWWLLIPPCILASAYLLGITPARIVRWAQAVDRWWDRVELSNDLLFGGLAILMAFGLLLLGFWRSGQQRRPATSTAEISVEPTPKQCDNNLVV